MSVKAPILAAKKRNPKFVDSFSSRLKLLMDERNVSIVQLSRAVNKSSPTVHKWLHGGKIEHETLKVLAKFLGVSWIWLCHGPDELAEACRFATGVMPDSVLTEIIASERRYTEVFQALEVGVWEIDNVRRRLHRDRIVAHMMSGTVTARDGWVENLDQRAMDLIVAEDLAAFNAQSMGVDDETKTGDMVYFRFRAKWRPETWLNGLGVVSRDGNGRLMRITGSLQIEKKRKDISADLSVANHAKKKAPKGASKEEG